MLLAKDKLMFTQDRRLAVNVNGTNHILTVSSLKGADSADYQYILAGEITGPFAVIHRLNVHELPSARIESANGTLTVFAHREVARGDNVFIRCHVYGNPPPRTRWHRLGGGRLPMEYAFSETLWIRNAAVNDSGIYECQAETDDASGSAQVEIAVKDDAASSNRFRNSAICRDHAECGENAQCVYCNHEGYYMCLCLSPYVGDGIECSREVQRTPVSIDVYKKTAEYPDQAEASTVATGAVRECDSADENLLMNLRMTKITVHLTRNQKLEFISDDEYQAFKARNPEYFD